MLSTDSLIFKLRFGRLIGRGIRFGQSNTMANSGLMITPSNWQTVCIYLFLSNILLIVSAYSAQIELRQFPKNPLRWHLFVMSEVMNISDTDEKYG
jgi:hypothetical protein